MSTSTPFRDLLHAANLRHGTDGFTSPPKEGVLRIFSPLKNQTSSAGFEPANLGTKGQHATPRPPKPNMLYSVKSQSDGCVVLFNSTNASESNSSFTSILNTILTMAALLISFPHKIFHHQNKKSRSLPLEQTSPLNPFHRCLRRRYGCYLVAG